MGKIKTPTLLILGISLLCVCVITLFFAWHLFTTYIQKSDGWDLISIAQLLDTPLPSDASDIIYSGMRRGQLTWLELSVTASLESLNNFAVTLCNQPLQQGFDPTNAIYLSSLYNDLNPSQVLVNNQTIFAYAPPNGFDLFGTQCEISTGYLQIVVHGSIDPILDLNFSSVCFYPCRLNHIDQEVIQDSLFVFRGFAFTPNGGFNLVGNLCVELHPEIGYKQDTSYIGAQLSILIDGNDSAIAIVSDGFQLEPLAGFNVNASNSQLFDVCFIRTWNAGEYQIDLMFTQLNGNVTHYSFEFIY